MCSYPETNRTWCSSMLELWSPEVISSDFNGFFLYFHAKCNLGHQLSPILPRKCTKRAPSMSRVTISTAGSTSNPESPNFVRRRCNAHAGHQESTETLCPLYACPPVTIDSSQDSTAISRPLQTHLSHFTVYNLTSRRQLHIKHLVSPAFRVPKPPPRVHLLPESSPTSPLFLLP